MHWIINQLFLFTEYKNVAAKFEFMFAEFRKVERGNLMG